MKMDKATDDDMAVALDVCSALEALAQGYLPNSMAPGEDVVSYDAKLHAADVVEHLLDLAQPGSLFRVAFGMTVLLDPRNEIVDPEKSSLESHPKFTQLASQLAECQSAIDAARAELHDDRYAGSKDWRSSGWVERVRWLTSMYDAKKSEADEAWEQLDACRG